MKRTFIVSFLGILSFMGVGYATDASMCVHISTTSANISSTGGSTGNRAGWVVGSRCGLTNGSCSEPPYLKGEAHCSDSGVYPASNWEEYGGVCWCRISAIQAANGYMIPHNGAWVPTGYAVKDTWASLCERDCSNKCVSYATSDSRVLRTMLVATLDD